MIFEINGRPGVSRALSAAACLVAVAVPARADLTADQVWDQWRGYMESFGYDVTADTSTTGNSLTVDNMTMVMNLPEAEKGGTFRMSWGTMTLTSMPDGSVDVGLPASFPVVVRVEPTGEPAVDLALTYATRDFAMKATGTPEDTVYTYSAGGLGITLDSVMSDGQPMEVTAQADLTGISGVSSLDTAAGFSADQTFDAESVSYAFAFTSPDPAEPGSMSLTGTATGLNFEGSMAVPEGMDIEDMAAALTAGYAMAGTFTYQSGQSDMTVDDAGEAFAMSSTTGTGTAKIAMDKDGFVYDVRGTDAQINVTGDSIPFPVDIAAGEIGLDIAMPLSRSDELQTFGAGLTLADIKLPEMIWGMFDPTGGLPHDPVTVRLDLSGVGRLFVDLTDEAQMSQLGATGGLPGEVQSLKLEELLVSGLGARIAATADLDVDNNAMSPLGPFPNVFGVANIQLNGVKGLIEKLSGMGLLPPGQAMMASAMISELGKPGSGPDDLSADLELTPNGALTVNGKPIPLQ